MIQLTDHLVLFDWYGWRNPNSCLLEYFDAHGAGENRNLGVTLLPLHFWQHLGFRRWSFGAENKRTFIGLGLVSVFWDSEDKEENIK